MLLNVKSVGEQSWSELTKLCVRKQIWKVYETIRDMAIIMLHFFLKLKVFKSAETQRSVLKATSDSNLLTKPISCVWIDALFLIDLICLRKIVKGVEVVVTIVVRQVEDCDELKVLCNKWGAQKKLKVNWPV